MLRRAAALRAPIMVETMEMGTPWKLPVMVRKPREDSYTKSGRPGAGGSRYSLISSARFSLPTDRMRLATSPFCGTARRASQGSAR